MADDALTRTLEAYAEAGRRFGEAVTAYFERAGRAMAPLVEVFRQAYRDAGAPYGDTDEGMLRWIGERRQIADLRAQADRLEQIHDTCARLRAGRR